MNYCLVVPSGRAIGGQYTIGGGVTPVFGAESVTNYDTGQVTGFALTGAQFSGLVGASGSLSASFTFGNLGANNANYAGPFIGGFVSGPLLGLSGATSKPFAPLSPVHTLGVTAGGGGPLAARFGVTLLGYSHPRDMGNVLSDPSFNTIDAALMLARIPCH